MKILTPNVCRCFSGLNGIGRDQDIMLKGQDSIMEVEDDGPAL
jgi:hypothetical protein